MQLVGPIVYMARAAIPQSADHTTSQSVVNNGQEIITWLE